MWRRIARRNGPAVWHLKGVFPMDGAFFLLLENSHREFLRSRQEKHAQTIAARGLKNDSFASSGYGSFAGAFRYT